MCGGRAAWPCPPAARNCRPGLAAARAAARLGYRRVPVRALLPALLVWGWPSCGHRHGVRGWAQVLRVSPIKYTVKEMGGVSHQAKNFLDRPHCISLYEILARKSQA